MTPFHVRPSPIRIHHDPRPLLLTPYLPHAVLLVAPALGYLIRVFLAALRLHYQVLRELKQEGSLPGHRRSRGHRKRRYRDARRSAEHSHGFLRAFVTGEASPRTDAMMGGMGIEDFSDLYEDVEGGGADPLLRPEDSDSDSEAGAYAYAADEEAVAREAERARELARERRREREEEHERRRRQRARAERAAPRASASRDRDLAAWGSDVEDVPLSGDEEPAPLPSPGSSTRSAKPRRMPPPRSDGRGDDSVSVSSLGSRASRSTGRSSTRRQGMSRSSRQRRARTRDSSARSVGTASFMRGDEETALQGPTSSVASGTGSLGGGRRGRSGRGEEAQPDTRDGAEKDSAASPGGQAQAAEKTRKRKKKKKREKVKREEPTDSGAAGFQDHALAAEELAAAALKTAGDMAERQEGEEEEEDFGASGLAPRRG